jgi:hydrogenase-4 component E
MTGSGYATVLDFAVAAMLLTAVLGVWLRQLSAQTALLVAQGAALGAIPITIGAHSGDGTLIAVGCAVLVLRAAVLPALVARVIRGEQAPRETEPLINASASLLIAAGVTGIAYAVTRPLLALDSSVTIRATPAAFAVVLIGVFLLVSRGRALSQIIGFLMLDNGIAALAFLTTAGLPLIVELGASTDVLLAVLILQVLTGRMRVKFGGTDLDRLRELRDR